MPEERLPQRVRNALYIIWVLLSVAQPFAVIYMLQLADGEALVQALVATISIIGTFAGATALAHPTAVKRGKYGDYSE